MDALLASARPVRMRGLSGLAPALVLVVMASLVVGAHLYGTALGDRLRAAGENMKLGAPPLFGRVEAVLTPGIAFPLVVAAAVVVGGTRIARSLTWARLLLISVLVSGSWAVALALSNGSLTAPLEAKADYLAVLPKIGDLGMFVESFGERLGRWPVHVEGHPPGMVVLLSGMAAIGLAGSGAAAALIIISASTIAAAAMIAVRAVADEDTARRAAPFLVLAPAAVWIATSADALFAAVIAWSIATFAVAVEKQGWPRYALAGAAGLLFGCALFLSYGAAPLALVFLSLTLFRRAYSAAVAAGLGAAVVTAIWAAQGFWWFDGLAATIERYELGVASVRPFSFFVWANLAAFALAVGPAALLGGRYLKRSRLWVLAGAALLSLLLADLSGLSKGEVERIWLPFVPWVLVLASAIPQRFVVPALASQAGLAIAIQTFVRTPW